MLSLGPLQMKGDEVIADAVQRYLAATGRRSFGDATFAMVDFGELQNTRREPCWIPDTAKRGRIQGRSRGLEFNAVAHGILEEDLVSTLFFER